MKPQSRPTEYFDDLYAASRDPWNFETSAYEQEKYQSTLTILAGRRFKNAFEAGCSIGVFTKLLAPHCDRLLATDVAETALGAARARCADDRQVTFQNLRLPTSWPAGETFDLILFSEILYFLSPDDIAQTAALARQSLANDGMILLVNYTEAIEEACSGEAAAACFITASNLTLIARQRHPKYRIDLLAREAVLF